MKKIHIPLIIASIFYAVIASAQNEPKLILDRSLNGDALAAWMTYGGTRLLWVTETYFEKNPNSSEYKYSFQEELAARQNLLKIWQEFKNKDQNLKNEYLDTLLSVKNAGFLPEYVWYYFHVTDWGKVPGELKLNKFTQWRSINLPGHEPKTLAFLEIKNKLPANP